MDTGQGIGHRQGTQVLLYALEVGNVGQVAMPERAAVFTDLWCRLPAHPAQAGFGQAHTVLFTPG
ncbi:hypothetical protein D3C81_1950000 [compost metagenome]